MIHRSVFDLGPRYDALFAAAEARSVFQSREWFETMERLGVGAPRIIAVGDEALLLGRLPPKHGLRRLEPRILRSFTNTQSFRSSLIVEPSRFGALGPGLLAGLREADLHGFEVELLAVPEDAARALARSLERAGCAVELERQDYNRFERVAGVPFSKLDKKSARRREKKLRAAHAVREAMIVDAAGAPEAFRIYEEIYANTWKQPEAARPFVVEMVRRAAARGWLRVALMWVDDRPAAAEIFFVHGGIASSFKTAYDLALKEHSVGSINLLRMFKHVMEVDGVEEIDFGPGDEEYKHEWLSERRPLWRLRAWDRRRVRGLAGFALEVGKRRGLDLARTARDRIRPYLERG